jgi:hypothetical protein
MRIPTFGKQAALAVVLTMLAGLALPAQAQIKSIGATPSLDRAATCPSNFSVVGSSTLTMICYCGPEDFNGSLWGSSVYTADSSICQAALHAGAVVRGGGMVVVKGSPGEDDYPSAVSNGVESSSWGSYDWSFTFPGARASEVATACPANLTEFRGSGESLVCSCAPDAIGGTVWGTDVYTDDSSVCAAALHAGAIGGNGGVVTVVPAPGEGAYLGTSRNGITTQDYGTWSGSFYFVGDADSVAACPGNMTEFRGSDEIVFCGCAPGDITGTVWGTDTYTDDSSICAAALHFGAISVNGGVVAVVPAPGEASYTGSSRNGIVTQDYGSWSGSYFFR